MERAFSPKEREELKKKVRGTLGGVIRKDIWLVKGLAEKLDPDCIYPQTRGQLLALKTVLSSAIENLDSLLEFDALVEVVEEDDLVVDEDSWELDTKPRDEEGSNGKKKMYV